MLTRCSCGELMPEVVCECDPLVHSLQREERCLVVASLGEAPIPLVVENGGGREARYESI
jgi:hypothetical protein